MDMHFLLGYDENKGSKVANSIFTGEVGKNDIEYLATKDTFGDKIFLRDEKTHIIENFLGNFLDVSSTESYPVSPRILCLVSDKTDKVEIEKDLYSKFSNGVNYEVMKEVVQINDSRVEVIPYISADRVYAEIKIVSGDKSTNLAQQIEKLLTVLYSGMDLIIQKIWNIYKNIVKLLDDNMLKMSEQFRDIVLTDLAIVELKCRIDLLKTEIVDLSALEKKYAYEDIDLRAYNTNEVYSIPISGSGTKFGRYYIIQTESTEINPKLSSAVIDVLGNVVVDYINGSDHNNGIVIHPDYMVTKDNKIFLLGGRRYRVFRTPDTIPPTVTKAKVDSKIIDIMKIAPASFRKMGVLVNNQNKIFLEKQSGGHVEFIINSK